MRSLPTIFRIVEELSKAAVSRAPFRDELMHLSRVSNNQRDQFPRLQVSQENLPTAGNAFQVSMNMAQFKPSELSVKVVDNNVVVEGKYEGRKDENGYIFKKFVHYLKMPSGLQADNATSTLATDGMLTVTIPKPQGVDEKPVEKVIPIQHTTTTMETLKIEGKSDSNMFTMQPSIPRHMSTATNPILHASSSSTNTPNKTPHASASTSATSTPTGGSGKSPTASKAGTTNTTYPKCPATPKSGMPPPPSTAKPSQHSFKPDTTKDIGQNLNAPKDSDEDKKHDKKAKSEDDKQGIGFEQSHAKELKSDKELDLEELTPKDKKNKMSFQQSQQKDLDVQKKDMDWDFDDFDGKDHKTKKADKKMKSLDLDYEDHGFKKKNKYASMDEFDDFDDFDFDKKKSKKYKAKKKHSVSFTPYKSKSYDFKKKGSKDMSFNFKGGKNKKNKSHKKYKKY